MPDARLEALQLAGDLPGVLLDAKRLAASAPGVHGRRRAGQGEAFWQYRDHRPEDGARLVDWRRSARGDRYYVREREREAAQTAWFWLDPEPGFNWTSDPARTTKLRRALTLALALAILLARGGERVGALGHPARAGANAVTRLASVFSAPLPLDGGGAGVGVRGGKSRNRSSKTEDGNANPRSGIKSSSSASPHPLPPPPLGEGEAHQGLNLHGVGAGACLIFMSDFYAPIETWRSRLAAAADAGASGALVMIADPAEEDFPFQGRTLFRAPGARAETLIGRAENARAEYADRLSAHRRAIHALGAQYGFPHLLHRTDRAPAPTLAMLMALVAERFA